MSVCAKEREVTSAFRVAHNSGVGAHCPAPSKGLLKAGFLACIPLGLEIRAAEAERAKSRIKGIFGLWKTAFGI